MLALRDPAYGTKAGALRVVGDGGHDHPSESFLEVHG
jgi:hypothetical protein